MSDAVLITLIICGTILAVFLGVAGITFWLDSISWHQLNDMRTRITKLEKLTKSSTYGK